MTEDLLSFLRRLTDGHSVGEMSQEQCMQGWTDKIEVLSHVPWFRRIAEQASSSLSINSHGHIGNSDCLEMDCALTAVILKISGCPSGTLPQLLSCPAACESLPHWAAILCSSISNEDVDQLMAQCVVTCRSHGGELTLGVRSAAHVMKRFAALDSSALLEASIDLWLKHQGLN